MFKESSRLIFLKVFRKISAPCWKILCQLRTDVERWYFTIKFCSKEVDYSFTIMSCNCRVYYLIFKEWPRPSSLFTRADLYNDNAYVTKIKHNRYRYNVQVILRFYHNPVRPVIREACYSPLENTCMPASYSRVLFECVCEPRKVSVHVYVC